MGSDRRNKSEAQNPHFSLQRQPCAPNRLFQLCKSTARLILKRNTRHSQNGLSPIPLEKLTRNLFLERLNLEAQSRLAEVDDFCRATEVQRLRERKKRTNMSELYAA
jgi:hypothetical protein